jgi:hypothetical protein
MRACWLALVLALWLLSVPAQALYTTETDKGSVSLRGAFDLSAGVTHAPYSPLLFPDRTEGLYAATLRLLLDASAGEHVIVEFNGYQAFVKQPQSLEGFGNSARPYRTRFLETNWASGFDTDWKANLVLDNLLVKVFAGPLDVTVGRQPIGLGTMYIFSPNDVFYPFDSTQVDREFRPGVDALRLDITTGLLSKIMLVGVLGYGDDDAPSFARSALLARGRYNFSGWDWIVMGGKADSNYRAGVEFNGEAGPLGLRGEVNITIPDDDPRQDWYTQVAAGLDHRFDNTLHLVLEYFYRGNGTYDPHDYLESAPYLNAMNDPYFGRHYLGLMLSGELLPILTMQGVVIANLTDPSFILSPGLSLSASDEIQFTASVTLPIGRQPGETRTTGGLEIPQLRSEYGTYPISASLLGRFYF